jgi:hypothetical protein
VTDGGVFKMCVSAKTAAREALDDASFLAYGFVHQLLQTRMRL